MGVESHKVEHLGRVIFDDIIFSGQLKTFIIHNVPQTPQNDAKISGGIYTVATLEETVIPWGGSEKCDQWFLRSKDDI